MKKIVAKNDLQKRYTYRLQEPAGKNFHPDFKPALTPQEMFSLGVFGGAYFEKGRKEFPHTWFKKAKLSKDGTENRELNYFKVAASQSREEWQRKGWIHKDDPRGWFEWYCRYFLGRRHEDDERQIKRWKAMSRHVGQLVSGCMRRDLTCRRRQRQALLHWAYDSRKI